MTSQISPYEPDEDALAAQAVESIWNRYPGYSADRMQLDELAPSVRENVRLAIRVARRGSPPTFDELGEARHLGARRAALGVPLESVAQAYRSTERTILMDVMARSADWPGEVRSAHVDLVISSFDLLTDHMINSYRETSATIEDARRRREDQFLQQLSLGRPLSELEADARDLGLDPRHPQLAVAIAAPNLDAVELQRLRRRLREALRPHSTAPVLVGDVHGMSVLLMSPRSEEVDAAAQLSAAPGLVDADGGWVAGIGEIAAELGQAAQSISEARAAAQASVNFALAPVTRYQDVLVEVLLADRPRLADRIARRLKPLDGHRHLVETLRALLDHGLSQSAAARALFVHVNTIAYRIRRIEELTGANPLDARQLAELHLALRWRDAAGALPSRAG
ncbi:helix-turn-helix domain-containing protein [Sediminivirga luteola]|uniref:PucR-like helix-turn-helix protein n=1 Tax=Sediminivirga luteola TaxID=1774748 RepID=A0A8J2TX64_9MICO|nr:helix-turn-helix domain-containing protein [Sediminivirga luteola]GGA10113.1 hypothetical protein GCM10011333_11040 [Sediminivirga luteola]